MPLPTIEVPKFNLTVPSTGETLKYRPFIVRENKLMLQAIEMKDRDQLDNAVEDVLKACTFGEFDIDNSPVYDVEYVMLQVRAKSQGEVVNMMYRCNAMVPHPDGGQDGEPVKCNTKIPVEVPLPDAQVETFTGHEYKIMLTDTVGVMMRDLPYGLYKTATGSKSMTAGIDMIMACVDKVFDEEGVQSRKDFTDDELEVFLGNLDADSFGKLEEFMDTMPKLRMTIPMKCPKCGTEDRVILTGLDDFLA